MSINMWKEIDETYLSKSYACEQVHSTLVEDEFTPSLESSMWLAAIYSHGSGNTLGKKMFESRSVDFICTGRKGDHNESTRGEQTSRRLAAASA